MNIRDPGTAHPNRRCTLAEFAERYHVTIDVLQRWRDLGLPIAGDGTGDPFAVVNWITWNRLAEAPVLRRAWRGYLTVFSGFLAGDHRPRRLRWSRRQEAFLDATPASWTWLVPRPRADAFQRIRADDGLSAQAIPAGPWWRITGSEAVPAFSGRVDLDLRPRQTVGDHPVVADLAPLLRDLAAAFTYGYRHHRADEGMGPDPGFTATGSCLDAARVFADLARRRGHDAHIVAGLIASDAFANPHFWVEVHHRGQIIPFDPSLAAIARMLGADWQAVAQRYSGGCDARRVAFCGGLRHDRALHGVIGDLTVDGADAWPCLDWVCGECADGFSEA